MCFMQSPRTDTTPIVDDVAAPPVVPGANAAGQNGSALQPPGSAPKIGAKRTAENKAAFGSSKGPATRRPDGGSGLNKM